MYRNQIQIQIQKSFILLSEEYYTFYTLKTSQLNLHEKNSCMS